MNEAEENNWSNRHDKKEYVFSIRTGYSMFATLCQTNENLGKHQQEPSLCGNG